MSSETSAIRKDFGTAYECSLEIFDLNYINKGLKDYMLNLNRLFKDDREYRTRMMIGPALTRKKIIHKLKEVGYYD